MSTAEVNAFVDEIRETLGLLITPSLTNSSAPPKLFEAYILMLVLQAARNEGAVPIRYEDVQARPTNQFIFRASPGYIFSTTHDYTHAIIEFVGKPQLEVHMSVRVSGKSGVLHECDVAVIDRAEAITCRRHRVMPRQSKLLLGVECKYYNTSLELGLGRAFMGLVRDLSTRYSEIYFVTNSSHDPIQRLLAHHNEKWQPEIRPAILNNTTRLRALFQETFKNFKQRN